MTAHLDAYAPASKRFTAVIDGVTDWSAASPCQGWTARDVLGHVIGTQRDFLGRHDVDLGPAPDLEHPASAWRTHDGRVRELLADDSLASREFDGFFGPSTVGDTLVRFYGFDLLAHRWDLAQAAGREEFFSDDELDILQGAIDGFGEHLYADGICKPALEVPAEADRQTRVLARLGRRAR